MLNSLYSSSRSSIITVLSVSALGAVLAGCTPSAPLSNEVKNQPVDLLENTTEYFSDFSQSQQQMFADCDINENEFYRLMGLSFKEFDQDFKGGWRAYSHEDGCKAQAIELLKSYQKRQDVQFRENRSTLRWHTGQVLASTGDYEQAIQYFKQTYKDNSEYPEWNLYVDGTIAFLEKDKPKLKTARDKLAIIPVPEERKAARRQFLKDNPMITMPENFVDEPGNLSVLDKLLRCFDQGYNEAYGKCEL